MRLGGGGDPPRFAVVAAAPAYVGSDLAHLRDQVRWFGGMVGNHVAELVARYGDVRGVPEALTAYVAPVPSTTTPITAGRGTPTDFVPDEVMDRFCVLG